MRNLKAKKNIIAFMIFACMAPIQATAQDAEQSSSLNHCGNIGWEILGGSIGLIGGLGTGTALGAIIWVKCKNNKENDSCEYAAESIGLIATGIVTLFTVPAGTTIAGNSTDGQGFYWAALLGTAAVAVVASSAMVVFPEIIPEDWNRDEVAFSILGAGALGLVAGSIVGYRMSAPDTPQLALTPVQDGNGLLLTLSGKL